MIGINKYEERKNKDIKIMFIILDKYLQKGNIAEAVNVSIH